MESASRQPTAPVHPLFVQRWSPRAFAADPIPADQLDALFEAARWSPSCFNAQPWRFVYAQEGPARERILGLLAEANRGWAQAAPVVGVLFARRRFAHNDQPNRWAGFDAGAAALALSLQAQELGLSVHLMGGFDAEGAGEALELPAADYEAMAAFVIGKRGEAEALPAELAEREGPSDRMPRAEMAWELA